MISDDRNELKEKGKYKVSFLGSFVCNLYETYYQSSTVVERWSYVGITVKQ